MALLQSMLRKENQVEGIKAVGFFILVFHIIFSASINLKGEKTFLGCFPDADEKTRSKTLRWRMEWAVEREVLTDDCYPVSLICRITTGFHIVRLEFNTCFTTKKVSSRIVLIVSNFFLHFNRPFYRYSGHIELIWFKEYYRMPRGHEHISFVFSSAFRDIFS